MRDYYTLFHLTKEFQHLLGTVLVECFTQERNSLYLQFYDGEHISTLQFSAEPNLEALFLRKNFAKARSNYKDLFQELIGQKCCQVDLLEGERIVVFRFLSYELWFVLFGGPKTNCFVIDQERKIVSSFLSPKNYIGKNPEEVLTRKTNAESTTVLEFLRQKKYLGQEIARYFCQTHQIDCKKLLNDLTSAEFNELTKLADNFIVEIKNSKNFYAYFQNNKFFVSATEISSLSPLCKFFAPSEAVLYCYVNTLKYLQAKERYKELFNALDFKFKYLKKEIEEAQKIENIEKLIAEYQKFADLLISQPNLNKKGLKEIELFDFDGNLIKIPLKEELDIKQNAENYYQKIKKLRAKITTMEKIEAKHLQDFESIKNALDSLKKMTNYFEIAEFEKKYESLIKSIEKQKPHEEKISPFRSYLISEGAIIFVGRSARENEELTFGFARPNDYWFHARGVAGSHCVLKYSKGKVPPKDIIEKCAQIAAYFSKARNSDYVPVSYTQRKYIRKPKKTETGTVVLMKEDVIFVEPKPPEELNKYDNN